MINMVTEFTKNQNMMEWMNGFLKNRVVSDTNKKNKSNLMPLNFFIFYYLWHIVYF